MLTDREPQPGSTGDEPSAPSSKGFCSSRDERRGATRFQREPGTDFAVIWRVPGEEILVEVHDESLTGLGILVDAELGLQPGSAIHVAYAGECLHGEVRHISMLPGERYLIGLSCRRIVSEGSTGTPILPDLR